MNSSASISLPSVSCNVPPPPFATNNCARKKNKHVSPSCQDANSSSRRDLKSQPMTFEQAQNEIVSKIHALNVKQLRQFAKNKKICLFSAIRKSDIQSWILSHLQFELHKCYLGVLVQHHKSKPVVINPKKK